MPYPPNNNILGWWETMIHGLLMILTGLARVVTLGYYRPTFCTDFALWSMARGAEEEGDDEG